MEISSLSDLSELIRFSPLCHLTCNPDEMLSLQWPHCRGSVCLTWSSRAWHVSNVARDQSGISRWHPCPRPRPSDPHWGKVLQISILLFLVKTVPDRDIPSINIKHFEGIPTLIMKKKLSKQTQKESLIFHHLKQWIVKQEFWAISQSLNGGLK